MFHYFCRSVSDGSRYEKRGKGEPVCIDDEIPFDFPEGWEWARLESLISLLSGVDLNSSEYNDKQRGIPYLTGASNFDRGRLIENRWTECPRRESRKGDLLFTCKGTVGEMAVNSFNRAHIARQIMAIRPTGDNCLPYLEIFLGSLVTSIRAAAKGVIPGIERATLLTALIPIPPLAEQRRIAERVSELMPLVEEYGRLEDEREALDAALPERLRKSVLQMAVEGRLVPQDPGDEPASALLERIREERVKLIKEKKIKAPKGGESVTYLGSDGRRYEKRGEGEPACIDSEIPFDIPESWEWARLESVCSFGQCINVELADVEPGTWMLDLEDIEKDTGAIIQKKRVGLDAKGSTKHLFMPGMVLYSKLRPYLNKVVIADERGVCTSEILPLDFGELNARYAQIFLMSPSFLQFAKEHSYGVKMPRLGTNDGKLALVPVPPLAEQRRIADRVSELSALITNQ